MNPSTNMRLGGILVNLSSLATLELSAAFTLDLTYIQTELVALFSQLGGASNNKKRTSVDE